MRYQGTLEKWNDEKGFGFIAPRGGGERVFVHIKEFPSGRRPVKKEVVTYELSTDAKQRKRAANVEFIGETSDVSKSKFVWVVPIVSIGGTLMYFAGGRRSHLLSYYVLFSLVTFVAYAHDKMKAIKNEWRVPENALHLLALLGGWPGALLAQKMLRHKTKKTSFRVVFWITVLLNCAVVGWLIFGGGLEEISPKAH